MVNHLERTWASYIKKLNINLPYEPAIPPQRIYPKEMKMFVHKDTYTQVFIAAGGITGPNLETPKGTSAGERVNGTRSICAVGCHSAIKRDKMKYLLLHLKHKHQLSGRSQEQQTVSHDSIYVTCREKANRQQKKAGRGPFRGGSGSGG